MPQVDAKLGPILNGAVTGDFTQFNARGGKLIIFQGWADPIVAPDQTVALYKKLTEEFGRDQDFARLFMAPGLTHCGLGGTGLNGFESAQSSMLPPPSDDARHDLFVALGAWVEDKKTPTEGHQLCGQQRHFEGKLALKPASTYAAAACRAPAPVRMLHGGDCAAQT
jgi:tannase/feruloyl esterase